MSLVGIRKSIRVFIIRVSIQIGKQAIRYTTVTLLFVITAKNINRRPTQTDADGTIRIHLFFIKQ